MKIGLIDVDGQKFELIVIDSCEYLFSNDSHRGYLAHKGNCIFCKERNGK